MNLIFRIKEAFCFAFSEAPLLFLALAFIFGIWLKLAFHPLLLILFFLILCLIFYFSQNKKTLLIFLVFILAGWIETLIMHPSFVKLVEKTPAEATFKIHSIVESTLYKKIYLLKGTLKTLQLTSDHSNQKIYHNLPCTVYYTPKSLPKHVSKRPTANKVYKVDGTIRERGPYYYVFKAQNLKPIGSCWNLTEKRFVLQKKLTKLLRQKLKHKSAFIFLNSQMTGSMQSNLWRFIFTKTGQQHILAISGFHFMALLLFFSWVLKRLPLTRFLPWALLIVISLYALYIGPSPSVQRAWIAASVALGAQIIGKNNFALNTLGLGLLFELIIDPINLTFLSFQLSFLSVGAILFLYNPISDYLSRFLQKRTAIDCKKLSFVEKTGALVINYLRAALSISISVSLCLMPVLLFYFHKFPLLGLVYNLFFPLLISFSFYLLLIALITMPLMPLIPLSTIFFFLADNLAAMSLKLLASYPQCLDFAVRTKSISFPMVIIWLGIFFIGAILFKYRSKSALNPSPIF